MHSTFPLLRALALALVSGLLAPAPAAQDAAPDRVVVRLEDDATSRLRSDLPVHVADVADAHGTWRSRPLRLGVEAGPSQASTSRPGGLDGLLVLEFDAPVDVARVVAELDGLPGVRYAEPDYVGRGGGAPAPGTDDPHFDRQWAFENTGVNPVPLALEPGADARVVQAWEIETGSPDVVVAVLDSGARLRHPDLAPRLWSDPSDPSVHGYDFADNDADPSDGHGHGSNIAGIIGADANNGIGYAGVDQAARVMVLRVLDDENFGFYSWWAAAMIYAVDNGADVINMSLGGTPFSNALRDAAAYAEQAGVVVVASTMNTDSAVPFYPSALPTTLAVGATDGVDARAVPFCWGGGSNYGDHVDLVAPGDWIFGLRHSSDTDYGYAWCGTSQATAIVSGAASLLLARRPSLTPAEVRDVLTSTAVDQVGAAAEDVAGWDRYHGHGRLDVRAALERLQPVSSDTAPGEAFGPRVYPNPSVGRVVLEVAADVGGAVVVEVFDALGRRVRSAVLEVPAAGGLGTWSAPDDLAAGLYVVTATGPAGRRTRTLTVQ